LNSLTNHLETWEHGEPDAERSKRWVEILNFRARDEELRRLGRNAGGEVISWQHAGVLPLLGAET
jgi:hypothetical protein